MKKNRTSGLVAIGFSWLLVGAASDAASPSCGGINRKGDHALKPVTLPPEEGECKAHPKNNSGTHMVCELDHLVSLEIGGADTLDNIWPRCGPSMAALNNRYFKKKDLVENYLAAEIRTGNRSLRDVQKGITEEWTPVP